ncbi:hypothetical protein DMR_10510 [Solidesulfovibrio magneticus RS-1]|uniref:Uncharacterized protein n=1 Tax=Solidesulfovibrio magneticus (strain ATCC 700980 / DSM 13731 / RS-1) TaxID=573370 RepID=C4XL03_SOLM1|nr:hypothetical protein DMR_10510 [Solidesulfovibrio magneticus RS-1]
MNLTHTIEMNSKVAEMIQEVGSKILGAPDIRTQMHKSFLALYFINLIILRNKKFLEAYNAVGKENILISLYNSEMFLKEIELNFIDNNYGQIIRLLSSFLINILPTKPTTNYTLC